MQEEICLYAEPQASDFVEEEQIKSYKEIRRAAMNMLARREHSLKELEVKLLQKFPSDRIFIVDTVRQLKAEGLQSDLRFSESYFRWRSNKGFGFDRITKELVQKGVDEYTIEQANISADIDWLEQLRRQFQKKYHSQPPESLEDKAKYLRFFLYRGFSRSDIDIILK